MANLAVGKFGMINPFVIAASPATHGISAIVKSAQSRPGAIAMRNFRHGRGGGSRFIPSAREALAGKPAAQIHAPGGRLKGDWFSTLDEFGEGIARARAQMPSEIKLWVSLGAFWEMIDFPDWEKEWIEQAKVAEHAGADAVELHFNTPGIAFAYDRIYNLPEWVASATRAIKRVVQLPVMAKLAVEGVDPIRMIEAAVHAGADAIGPTARWTGLVMDLGLKEVFVGGYGGTQALPIISYLVAKTRLKGIETPMFAGGGVYTWQDAARLIMAGSEIVQIGTTACCLGPRAVQSMIQELDHWMDENGYADIKSLHGKALELIKDSSPAAKMRERNERLFEAYKKTRPDMEKCTGCGMCADVCWWYDALCMREGRPVKSEKCIGCGYCFQVCPTGALSVSM